MLSRGAALRLLHMRSFYSDKKLAHLRWPDAFPFKHKGTNLLMQNKANKLIYRNTTSDKKTVLTKTEAVSGKLENVENEKAENLVKETSTKLQQAKNEAKNEAATAAAAATTTSSHLDNGTNGKTVLEPAISIKTLEIKTSKGILSVTTTIEDSKINDVILEKTSATNPKNVNTKPVAKSSMKDPTTTGTGATTTKTGKEDSRETDKPEYDKSQQSITQAASAGVKKVVAALINPLPPTEKTDAAAVTTAPAPAQTTPEVHVLEKKTKKKTINATVKAMEKLAAATGGTTVAQPKIEILPPTPPQPKPPRLRVDFNRSSLERNFITPGRAMSDFLLKASDLENLPKIKRRSPYEQEPPMTVFWRRDVESKAIEVWGSRENLLNEQLKRDLERKKHQQNIFTVKRRLRDYRREIGARTILGDTDRGLKGESGKVVLIAIGINGMNFLFKVIGWLYTGSHSMFAECIHSLADTINQLILAYGIHKSQQHADPHHPYGYANWKYVSSLISGVGIFCVGTGLSIYHGITGLLHPEPLADLYWAFFILGGSLLSEGATLLVAMKEVRRSAAIQKVTFKEYVLSGRDPCVNVVLMEDAAAVSSVSVAASCMGLTYITGNPVYDAAGSLIVGGILGAVASFIIYTNTAALVGRSIDQEHLDRINAELESDVMIRAIHDVKGIDMGNSLVRYKAEMDFDGRELTRSYLDKQDLNELLKTVKSFQTIEELEQFLLSHGENIVDLMGGEIDRIEMKLRKKFPEIRHCDLEIL